MPHAPTPVPSWPYVSLRLDIRWMPNEPGTRDPTMWIACKATEGAGRGPAILFYRLSATVYGRLVAAVEKLEQPSKRKDEVTGRIESIPPSAQALASAREAVRLMLPLYEFLADRYADLAISEGATREDGWAALADDIAVARMGRAKLPEPAVEVTLVRMLERIGA